MSKEKVVFSQIMDLIPRRELVSIVEKYKGNRYAKNFSCRDQFLVMCMAQLSDKNSLRDIEASLIALQATRKLYHCGISYAVSRNTLAKANETREMEQSPNSEISELWSIAVVVTFYHYSFTRALKGV